MKITRLFFVYTILLSTLAASAENPPALKPLRQLSIGLGGDHFQVRDDIVAPLRWGGIGPVLNLSYSVAKKNVRHHLELRTILAFPENRYGHNALTAEINLGYSFLHRIAGNENLGQFFLGGLFNWSYNFQFYYSWDDSHMYWLNAYELGPVISWSKTLGLKNNLAVTFNLPLLALVSRPPEYRYYDQEVLPGELFSKAHENMELTSLHEYLSFGLQCSFTWEVSKKIRLGVSYLFNYKTFSQPRQISILSNTLLLKLLITLGKKAGGK